MPTTKDPRSAQILPFRRRDLDEAPPERAPLLRRRDRAIARLERERDALRARFGPAESLTGTIAELEREGSVCRGRVLVDMAQTDARCIGKAIADLNQAIRRKPDSAEVYTMRGVAFWMRRSETAAVADFSRAIELAPNDGEAWFCRARSRSALRDAAGSEADLRRAAELGHESAIEMLRERPELRWR